MDFGKILIVRFRIFFQLVLGIIGRRCMNIKINNVKNVMKSIWNIKHNVNDDLLLKKKQK